MAIALVRGENLRLYRKFQMVPHANLNLIIGDNAAGKTTLLEALYLAARGRSFRAQNLSELCGQTDNSGWNVFVELKALSGSGFHDHRIGIGWTREGMEIRLDEVRNVPIAEVVRTVPLQLIDPLAHRLLEDGPSYRRSFVDWGVFHVEHSFLDIWRRHQRALKQRNKALKDGLQPNAVRAWDEELATTAEKLTELRETHVSAVQPSFKHWAQQLVGVGEISVDWQRGWPATEVYREVLERNLQQHQKLGTTVQGPHRAELRITVDAGKAKGRISRGQQKLLIGAMVLAQAEQLIQAGVTAPVLLVDDFASELAPEFQARWAAALAAYPGQVFVTAFEVPAGFAGSDSAVFHVEQGTIRPAERPH